MMGPQQVILFYFFIDFFIGLLLNFKKPKHFKYVLKKVQKILFFK